MVGNLNSIQFSDYTYVMECTGINNGSNIFDHYNDTMAIKKFRTSFE